MQRFSGSEPSLTRRGFLALTGGVVLLAACGSDDSDGSSSTTGAGDGTGGDADGGVTEIDLTEVSAGIVSADLHVSTDPQRFAFAVLAREGFASGRPASVRMAPQGSELGEFVDAELRADGLPEGRAVYTLTPVLDVAGVWEGELDYDGEVSPFFFEVREEPLVVVPGEPAISTPTATTSEPLDVDPICTLDPPCPFHEISLDDALASPKPVLVQFSTPARCQTQYCGPVLEQLVAMGPEFADDVEIVHVEIYKDLRSPDVADAVAAWGLPSEPWMFGIDASGTVTHRVDGAFDASETLEMLESLAQG